MQNIPSSLHTPQPFAKAYPWVAFVTLIFFFNYAVRSTLSPLLVFMEADLGISHAQSTSLLFIQGIGFAITQILSGQLVGIIRPRTVAVVGIIGAGLCLIPLYFVQSLYVAWVIFFFFGLCLGLYMPAGIAILGSLVHGKDWGKAIGIHELAPNLGFICVPLVAQAILMHSTWRSVFLIMGALCIVAGLLFALFGRGGYECTQKPSIKGSLHIFLQRNTWIFALLVSIGISGEFSVYVVLQLFLVDDLLFSPSEANMWLFYSRLATPLAVFLGGWVADRFSASAMIKWGLSVHALSLIAMSADAFLAPLYGVEKGTLLPNMALTGACMQAFVIALSFPSVFKIIAENIPMQEQPSFFSLILPLSAIFSISFMPWLLGILGQYVFFGVGFFILALVSIGGAISLSYVQSTKNMS